MMAKPMSRIREGLNRHVGIITAAVKQEMAYRFNFFTAILGAMLTMALLYYLWTAIYNSATSMEMSYRALITYVCLGQAFSFARPGQRRVLARIGYGIRRGDVVLDLIRPTDYQLLTFSETLGAYLMEIAMVSLPSYLLALLVFGIDLPASPEAAIGFVVSLMGAIFLIFSLDFLVGLMGFWTFSVWGLGYAKIAVINILAGTIIPLTLFPDWLQRIVLILPFKGMAYTPLAIYVGEIDGSAIWMNILGQFAWGIGLVLLTRLLWLRARRRIEIQGG
jgi:ABC-2 type transport system permease protein